jgi:hypothetical protein
VHNLLKKYFKRRERYVVLTKMQKKIKKCLTKGDESGRISKCSNEGHAGRKEKS